MKQGTARGLALAAIVGTWSFNVAWLVAPLWQDHYRVADQMVSEMGGETAHAPWIVNGGMLVWGISILCAAAAVGLVMPPNRWRTPIVATVALAGVVMGVMAFARVDCSASVSHACYERWAAHNASWHDTVHDWSARAFGILLALSSLAVGGFLRRRRPLLALVPAIGGAVGLAWTVVGIAGTPRFDPHAHWGLYQRFWILQASGWIVLLGLAVLMRLEEARKRTRPPGWTSAAPPTWSAARPTQPSA
jgi:Protein of unknown function (DUF998)